MLIMYFEGWFQCRLATDPDPSDDPRGVSGPTFACAGEPDLDRVIRLQNPVAPRFPHENDVGVNVRRVEINGQDAPNHPFIGATVELLDNAKFEGRNFIIAGTGREPIDPFHLRVSGGGVTLERRDVWDPNNPERDILDITPAQMERRQPTFQILSAEVAEATGIMDYAGYRQARMKTLQGLLAGTTDPTARVALQTRIDAIQKDSEGMFGITSVVMIFMSVQETFVFEINGQGAIVDDPANALGGVVGTSQNWPIRFWMGGYDADTLCAYLRGSLSIPFRPNP